MEQPVKRDLYSKVFWIIVLIPFMIFGISGLFYDSHQWSEINETTVVTDDVFVESDNVPLNNGGENSL